MERKSIFVFIFFLWASFRGNSFATQAVPTDEEIDSQIKAAQELYQTKLRSLEGQVNEIFQINFLKLSKELQIQMNERRLMSSFLNEIPDPHKREELLVSLKKEYAGERLDRFIEATAYLENEIEKDHLFVEKLLSSLEAVLDGVIQKDPIFRYAFLSPEFRNRYGLILRRVVWQAAQLRNVSAETGPLNVHSVFADKRKVPFLIKVTPFAFSSPSFLRSILIHELNHVYFYKEPPFSDARQFSSAAQQAPAGILTRYFKELNPFHPSYQYYLVHEYYSFKSQLLFDEKVRQSPSFRLSEADKKHVEKMLDWTYSQLNQKNKDFVQKNPNPPILPLIEKFYR